MASSSCLGLIIDRDTSMIKGGWPLLLPSTKASILMGEADSIQPRACLLARGGRGGSPVFIALCRGHGSAGPVLAGDAHWSLKPGPGSQLLPVLSIKPSALQPVYTLITEGSYCFIAWLESFEISPFLKGNVTWSLTLLFGPPGDGATWEAQGRDRWKRGSPSLAPARCHGVPDTVHVWEQLPQEAKEGLLDYVLGPRP